MQSIPKIRVLHVLPHFGMGGAEMLVKNMLLSHDKRKFEVAACSLFPKRGTIIDRELEENGIKVIYLNKKPGPDLKTVINLYHLFKQYKVSIIHTHGYILRYTLLPSIMNRIPVKIHTIHNIAEKEVDNYGKVIHWIAFKLFKVQPVGISQIISRSTENLYKIDKVPFVFNGIPTNIYQKSPLARQTLRNSLNILDSNIVIANIAIFKPQKNHRLLIESFYLIFREMPELILILVGDGELKQDIENFVRSKRLDENVKFLGLRKDIPAVLSASDICVLSSDWEGVPLVVLEAMAAGKPIVAPAVGGLPDIIINNITGILVPPKDPKALANAILKICRNRTMLDEMGNKGRAIAIEQFDIKIITQQYEDLYISMLKKTCN